MVNQAKSILNGIAKGWAPPYKRKQRYKKYQIKQRNLHCFVDSITCDGS